MDYKLLSRVLSNRLKKVMDQLIHRSQTYCVPGRSIVDNVSLIRDILEVSGSLGIDTGLVSLDQEKPLIGLSTITFESFTKVRPQPGSDS